MRLQCPSFLTSITRDFIRRALRALALLLLLLPGAGLAADDDVATLAIMTFGRSPAFQLTETAIFDTLEVYGYLSAEERSTLEGGQDLHGANINILFRDAGFDFPTANLMVEDVLDEGADVLLTLSNEVGMLAAGALDEMDEPPILFFAIVTAPYQLGLGKSSCIKPDYVSGTAMYMNYEEYVPVFNLQDPDLNHFGIIADPSDPTAAYLLSMMDRWTSYYGWTLTVANFTSASDLPIATQSLVDDGVDAIGILPHTTSSAGIPAIVEAAYGVPVYSMLVSDTHLGVTVGAGFDGWYREGKTAATMVVAHLKGELDIASTMISTTESYKEAVNLDSAALQGVEISQALMDAADYVIQDGETIGDAIEIPGVGSTMAQLSPEERMAADAEFLAGLRCTEEMIAEQQAALDVLGR